MQDLKTWKQRLFLLHFLFFFALVMVVLRCFHLQIFEHDRLLRLATEQQQHIVKLPARRGRIYDRSAVPLAISVEVPSVYINPQVINQIPGAAQVLAKTLGIKLAIVREKFQQERYFSWLKRYVSPSTAEAVKALGLAGVGIFPEMRRYYPNRDLAALILGFVGLDSQGLEGAEKSLNDELMGTAQSILAFRDAKGHSVLSGELDPSHASRGADITLTIDLQLQHAAEQALEKAIVNSKAAAGSVILLDVDSSDILAMAVWPKYNPNQAAAGKTTATRHRGISDSYEPGSVLKPLVVALAMDANLLDSESLIYCEKGHWRLGGHTINDLSPREWLSVPEILIKSSNIGMAKIAQKLGPSALLAGLRDMGFGQKSGVELPGESKGLLREQLLAGSLDLASMGFGQGIGVTALQLAAAYRILAAEGLYRAPRIVLNMQTANGSKNQRPLNPARQVLSPKTSQKITSILENVVSPNGTGKRGQLLGYRVAGKTGTAQKADSKGGYSPNKYTAWFAGYLPAQSPKVVIVVSIDEPQTNHQGGIIAAPVFAEVAEIAMTRLGIPSQNLLAAQSSSQQSNPQPSKQPSTFAKQTTKTTVFLQYSEEALATQLPAGKTPLPFNLFGMTAKESLKKIIEYDIKDHIEIIGSGRIYRQNSVYHTDPQTPNTLQLFLSME